MKRSLINFLVWAGDIRCFILLGVATITTLFIGLFASEPWNPMMTVFTVLFALFFLLYRFLINNLHEIIRKKYKIEEKEDNDRS